LREGGEAEACDGLNAATSLRRRRPETGRRWPLELLAAALDNRRRFAFNLIKRGHRAEGWVQ